MVLIPQTGDKFHRVKTCSGMVNPRFVNLSSAIIAGYTPCQNCCGYSW